MKVLALDYGAARTGVAVSDPTGMLARPLTVLSGDVVERVAELVREEGVDLVVVGLPLTLRGERGAQARSTEGFVGRLRAALDVPVETFDERFTTSLAEQAGGREDEDARAAAHLLAGYLERLASA
jgi:putative Holliday junction resolvase